MTRCRHLVFLFQGLEYFELKDNLLYFYICTYFFILFYQYHRSSSTHTHTHTRARTHAHKVKQSTCLFWEGTSPLLFLGWCVSGFPSLKFLLLDRSCFPESGQVSYLSSLSTFVPFPSLPLRYVTLPGFPVPVPLVSFELRKLRLSLSFGDFTKYIRSLAQTPIDILLTSTVSLRLQIFYFSPSYVGSILRGLLDLVTPSSSLPYFVHWDPATTFSFSGMVRQLPLFFTLGFLRRIEKQNSLTHLSR